MVLTGKVMTAVSLLQLLHDKDSMKHLVLETKTGKQEVDSKTSKKLSFCPLCLYCGSNDLSYLNHVMVVHYNAAYGCGKCLRKVLLTSQTHERHQT